MLAHAVNCVACRERLLADPHAVFNGHALTAEEKERLAKLAPENFVTTQMLAQAAGVATAEIQEYRDHPVARLRHF